MFRKFLLIFNTVKYLKISQIFFQVFYRIKKSKSLSFYSKGLNVEKLEYMEFDDEFQMDRFITGTNSFTFLNLTTEFQDRVDWGFEGYGKLWNYNLQYFNYLGQSNVTVEYKVNLIQDFNSALRKGELRLEPYPTSLRIINILRFCIKYKITDKDILSDIYAQCIYLDGFYEYHILGNHLLENAFAMAMAGEAFNNIKWKNRAVHVLTTQLDEQILDDGGHFELSPMYHNIILYRILELIEWYQQSKNKDHDFESFLYKKAHLMLCWLKSISFDNGTIPHFNDSADGITLHTQGILLYAEKLGIKDIVPINLSSSGYKSYKSDLYECKIDVGPIGARYQPGHSHADALSFVMNYKEIPFLVEAGTSTYQIGHRRNYERSTAAHNTVVIGGKDQSEVWGGFRTGRRADVQILDYSDSKLLAQHDGYKANFNVLHKRQFTFNENSVFIDDEIGDASGQFRLHFHPDCKVEISPDNVIEIINIGRIKIYNSTEIVLDNYEFAQGFNKYCIASMIIVEFDRTLKSEINLN